MTGQQYRQMHRQRTKSERFFKERLRQQKIADEIAWRMHARLDREMDERIEREKDENACD